MQTTKLQTFKSWHHTHAQTTLEKYKITSNHGLRQEGYIRAGKYRILVTYLSSVNVLGEDNQ